MIRLLPIQLIALIIITGCGESFKTTRVHEMSNKPLTAEPSSRLETGGPDMEVGLQLFREGDFDSAASFFQRQIFANPKSWQGYYYLGLIHNQIGRFQSAVEYFHQCLEKLKADSYPRSLVYAGIGDSYRLQGKIGQARLNYHTAMNLDPNCKEAGDGLALLQLRSGR